jgi:prefoldin subunit 5
MPPEDESDDPIETLIAEHKRLERSIASMTERMHRIEENLHSVGISEDDIAL